MFIVSIDIGIFNLGYASFYCEENRITNWKHLDKINIKEVTMNCRKPSCRFCHDKTFTDYIDHFCEMFSEDFKNCDYVLLERQPPAGFVVIQELILNKFRNKTKIVSPNSVHKFFGIGHLDYDNRKLASIETARKTCPSFSNIKTERRHDISDAICQAIYFVNNLPTAKPTIFEGWSHVRLDKSLDFTQFEYQQSIP